MTERERGANRNCARDHIAKWYKLKPEFVVKNMVHEFSGPMRNRQTPNPSHSYFDVINSKKGICLRGEFAIPIEQRVIMKGSEKLYQISGFCQRAGNVLELENDGDKNCIWTPLNCPRRPRKEIGET